MVEADHKYIIGVGIRLVPTADGTEVDGHTRRILPLTPRVQIPKWNMSLKYFREISRELVSFQRF